MSPLKVAFFSYYSRFRNNSTCFCLQYLSCRVNSQGVAFTKAPHCSTPNNLTNPIIIRSHLACVSQCSWRLECFVLTFSEQASTCSMYLSDGTASISSNGSACTTETYCKGMYRVRFSNTAGSLNTFSFYVPPLSLLKNSVNRIGCSSNISHTHLVTLTWEEV